MSFLCLLLGHTFEFKLLRQSALGVVEQCVRCPKTRNRTIDMDELVWRLDDQRYEKERQRDL